MRGARPPPGRTGLGSHHRGGGDDHRPGQRPVDRRERRHPPRVRRQRKYPRRRRSPRHRVRHRGSHRRGGQLLGRREQRRRVPAGGPGCLREGPGRQHPRRHEEQQQRHLRHDLLGPQRDAVGHGDHGELHRSQQRWRRGLVGLPGGHLGGRLRAAGARLAPGLRGHRLAVRRRHVLQRPDQRPPAGSMGLGRRHARVRASHPGAAQHRQQPRWRPRERLRLRRPQVEGQGRPPRLGRRLAHVRRHRRAADPQPGLPGRPARRRRQLSGPGGPDSRLQPRGQRRRRSGRGRRDRRAKAVVGSLRQRERRARRDQPDRCLDLERHRRRRSADSLRRLDGAAFRPVERDGSPDGRHRLRPAHRSETDLPLAGDDRDAVERELLLEQRRRLQHLVRRQPVRSGLLQRLELREGPGHPRSGGHIRDPHAGAAGNTHRGGTQYSLGGRRLQHRLPRDRAVPGREPRDRGQPAARGQRRP